MQIKNLLLIRLLAGQLGGLLLLGELGVGRLEHRLKDASTSVYEPFDMKVTTC